MTAVVERPAAPGPPEPLASTPQQKPEPVRRTGVLLGAILGIWVLGWLLFQGVATLPLGRATLTGFHTRLNELRDSFDAARDSNVILDVVVGGIRDAIDAVVVGAQDLLSQPAFPRPVPQIGWLGVVALLAWVAYALAGVRATILVVLSLLSFGVLGYWSESIDLLIVTFTAVLIAVAVGIPLGIAMARSRAVTAIATPVLDVMQTMPSFAYLLPLVLLFSIGPSAAVVATLIYALPPVVRITAHGLRTVAASTIVATTSMGSTKAQLLRKVQLPMAKRTIVVGINQTIMAALSMATIAALIDGPGLGEPVIQALQTLDIGTAFVSGLAIVIMAIMLDRTTTAASQRAENERRVARDPRRRRIALVVGAVLAGVGVYLSRSYLWAADPDRLPDLGRPLADAAGTATDWFTDTFSAVTGAIKDGFTYALLNPFQSLLADSPWWLVAAVLLAVAFVLGGWRPTLTTAVCLAVIFGVGLWQDTMVTLTMTLVATVLVMLLAVVFGVWMGRSKRADTALRPLLDAGQTIPPFVYLVPALALFGTSRFTAIVAAIVYAAPAAIKLVADGIRGVSPTTVEAAESAGSSRLQIITKVQLPMARSALVLASNQGLLYVLSMVVIGGLVGGGALGYTVVSGFSQAQLFGKGLAAGIAIVALGIMLDRITQHAAARSGRR
ncbi:MAG: ABC transporter permease subunit [Geodermatophilaceae bacterium]|nr:ABC transporter permease subunit [Geodermatophilaceae bacterium]